jgi:diadenylate cyclase
VSLLGHHLFSWFWLVQILDIALVTYLVWLLLRAIWGQPVMRVIIAVVLVWGISVLLNAIGFYSIGMITGKLASVMIFALIVIFSREVRDILARFGRYLSRIGFLDMKNHQANDNTLKSVEAVLETCNYLRERGYGGLIVLTRTEDISSYCKDVYDLNDLPVTAKFLEAFLTPPGPYHDGAIVIRGERISVARAILPLAFPGPDTMALGTRHRAAKGLAERTDAVVVVVSEETGKLRVAYDGKLTGSISLETLKEQLYRLMRTSRREESR